MNAEQNGRGPGMNEGDYVPVGDEMEILELAWRAHLPVLLQGPTGCGKTRLVETFARRQRLPLTTVSCTEDLSAADLTGRYLLESGETQWHDGPLTTSVRAGGLCYLDEIVEARADATVVIHPLTDHRRTMFLERLGEEVDAPDSFMLVMSYNPGYQSVLKDLKPSTRQRFVVLEMGFPPPDIEREILRRESRAAEDQISQIVHLATALRGLDVAALAEVASTRTLVAAARLVAEGCDLRRAAQVAIAGVLTDDSALGRDLMNLVEEYLPRPSPAPVQPPP